MLRPLFFVAVALLMAGCALPQRVSPEGLQYLAPPSFADAYDLVAEGGSYADDNGFLLVLTPRGSNDRVEIGGGVAAATIYAESQPIEGDEQREAIMLRGVNAAVVETPDLITMVWQEGATPYFVRVTTSDAQTVQIFVNALASYEPAAWRAAVGLP